ncbi:1-phosphatidylinositol 4,5-bisphosphate phosphodiesterase classes I and II-like isoform X2 [Pectinophora gossypiella]|uniref:1-phosphatidylinositol 4,5-bisphosphate phosphodiesterase classes I and II-like isoform X2 n=1 Tax=Pectinophora gossypiella TaxID=13191 RepID=UPI00214EB5E1|nr:1-phosphatidylinositol 4,5-bisphosphate phosphodiesterase classes I and II-like isoform X2 [Pectinophora gossypiella]
MTTTTRSSNVSLKPIEVSKALIEGEKFIKWDEDSGGGLPVTLRVDPKGFYMYWTDQNMEVELLDIATIRDVRTGPHAKVPKDPKIRNVVLIGSQGSLEEKTVTVCYGADFVNVTFINFCCTRKEIAQMWTEELFKLAYNLNQLNNPTIKFLEKLHTKISLKADKSGKILVKNIVRSFAQNKDDKKRVEKALSDTGLPTSKNDTISQSKFQFEDFFAFYKNLTQRNEVQKIFNQLTDGKPHLSANQLVDFLNEVQRDPRLNEILHPYADLQRAKDLIKTYEHNKYHQQRSQLTFDGFLRFLMSEDNPIVQPSKMDLCDDMEQPLAHYFINSSHNTYLTGHQITGKSSVEIYRQSLLAGCRCVELDFWNGRTEEPVIVHGYTFVPEISAKEVLEAIAESAFKTSDFPVILSFENHCNPRQQAKIANYCRDIFGEMLLDKPLDTHKLYPGGKLPPPSLLRHKIIIKNKKKHHHHHKKEDSVASGVSEQQKDQAAQQAEQPEQPLEQVESSEQPSDDQPVDQPTVLLTEAEPQGNGDVSEAEDTLGKEILSKDPTPKDTSPAAATPKVTPSKDPSLMATPPKENSHKESSPKAIPSNDNSLKDTSLATSPKENSLKDDTPNATPSKDSSQKEASSKDTPEKQKKLVRQGSKDSTGSASDASEDGSSSGEEEAVADAGAEAEKRETHAGAEISALVNYVQPVHFSSFENAEKKNRFYEMSSFDEKQATTLLKERPIEFVNYNKHQLSRVYPAGTRFDSSNFMPQVFWNAGCQLVALNYQTLDLAMQLNLGTFEYNRRCGYLLKPEFMRRKDRRLDPFAESTVDGIIAGSLSVTVLSGQLLTDKRCGTYVEVDMFGLPADTVRKKFRTRVAPNNGINPLYGEEPFVFKKVVLPELAMIRIAAHEESGRLLGHRVLPVVGLCPGYRHVNLRTELGLPLPASLLLLVVVKDYVPDRLSELAEALANPIKYQSELDKREHQLAVLTEDTDVQPEDEHIQRLSAIPLSKQEPPTDTSPSKSTTAIIETKKLIEQESISSAAPPSTTETTESKDQPDNITNGNSDEHLAKTLDNLLSSKVVREKRSELARKLDALRRKYDKDKRPASKFYVSNKLVKRLSSKNIVVAVRTVKEGAITRNRSPVGEASSGGTEETSNNEIAHLERELRLRYHHAIYAAIEKQLRNDQHHQMKTLTDLLEGEKKEILNRLANSRKEDVKALAKKTNKDKDEILRIKREIHTQSVERGVAECSRLEQSYARRREQLARAHERLRALLQKHRDQELLELERLCGGAPEG